jgi:hypothetical protein
MCGRNTRIKLRKSKRRMKLENEQEEGKGDLQMTNKKSKTELI